MAVVLVMRFKLADEHKKRLCFVIFVEIFQSKVVYAVCSVTGKINFVSVFVEYVAVVTVRSKLQHIGTSEVFVLAESVLGYCGALTVKSYVGQSV